MFEKRFKIVAHRPRRPFLLVPCIAALVAPGLALVEGHGSRSGWLWDGPERIVFLGGNLDDEGIISFGAALAGSRHPGVFLLDSPRSRQYTQAFLREFGPRCIVPVGAFTEKESTLEKSYQAEAVAAQPWTGQPGDELWKSLFPRATRLVVAPATPRSLLLQSACLAGVLHAPLLVVHDRAEDRDRLDRCRKQWALKEIVAVGDAAEPCRHVVDLRVRRLPDEASVVTACLKARKTPARTLVLANPADRQRHGMSVLAPWIAWQRQAQLLCTSEDGSNVETVVEEAVERPGLKQVDSVVLAADLRAIPMQRRPNPLPGGKDAFIEMEPLTPANDEPFSFSVGRVFHDDLNVTALMLARPRLWDVNPASANKAILVSNPGGGLPLLETFSRNTAQELKNAGYQTTALFGSKASEASLRKLLSQQTIFLWEGHHSTLVREYEVPQWTEPLRPSLVFLQSCLALTEEKAHPFLRKGAIGVIGSSTRTYSASGGAFALAYFDALLYDRQSLGGSLRQAKNFMMAFSRLKDKRLAEKSKLRGASTRSAWAFTLWGDPTQSLPHPAAPSASLPRIHAEVHGNAIRIALPPARHAKSTTGRYEAQMWANARLGGLLRVGDEDGRSLVPLVFAEVPLKARPGRTPRFTSRLAGKRWVSCYDARRSCVYILAAPRADHRDELRFHVSWN